VLDQFYYEKGTSVLVQSLALVEIMQPTSSACPVRREQTFYRLQQCKRDRLQIL